MGWRHQQLKAALVLVAALSVSACHRADTGSAAAVDADAGGVPPVALPKDKLAPDELVEGTSKAFALPLPRDMNVYLYVDKTIDASGRGQQPAVTSFIQARVTGGKLLRGVHASDFKGVVVPAEPNRVLDIHVVQDRSQTITSVEVIDVTPVKPVIVPAAEAFRLNGMTPDGKLADPQHMQ